MRHERAHLDLNDDGGTQRVSLDVRGMGTLGAQLVLDPGSSAGSLVVQLRGRMVYEDETKESGGDERPGLPFEEIDSELRLTGEGATDRNIDVSRYAQVEAIVTTASGSASGGTVVLYAQ